MSFAAAEYNASAGGGAVEVTVNGSHEIKAIKIKPEVIDPEEPEMLEDLLMASLNEAMRKADETAEREMNKLTGGLISRNGRYVLMGYNIPALEKLIDEFRKMPSVGTKSAERMAFYVLGLDDNGTAEACKCHSDGSRKNTSVQNLPQSYRR